MIVKVCGVRSAAVAKAAVAAGADWVGLVFEPRSPRHASDEEAREVAAATAGGAQLIGVFVEPTVAACEAAASRYGLAAVQVHGDVALDFAATCSVPVIRGLNIESRAAAMSIDWWPDLLILLDSSAGEDALPGGTGRRLPPEWAAEVARHRRILLAGGLGADDVAAAIAAVRPHGVDASSRLESEPGVKDVALVSAYVQAARTAFAAGANGH